MRTSTRTRTTTHRVNGKKLHASKLLRPLKKTNKKIMNYVTHKPTQSIGVATLLTGLCLSLIYAKRLFR